MKDSPKHASTAINDPRIISLIAYVTLMGWFIAFLLNTPKQEQASFHIRQALGVNLIFLIGSMFFIIPILGWIIGMTFYIASFLIRLYGFSLAWEEDQDNVPIVGKYFQEWFRGL